MSGAKAHIWITIVIAPYLDKIDNDCLLFSARNAMPTIRRFGNCKIAIYPDNHAPPHFHIEGRGFRAVVEIETMMVRAGDIRKAAEAMEWARQNSALLGAEWSRLNRRA